MELQIPQLHCWVFTHFFLPSSDRDPLWNYLVKFLILTVTRSPEPVVEFKSHRNKSTNRIGAVVVGYRNQKRETLTLVSPWITSNWWLSVQLYGLPFREPKDACRVARYQLAIRSRIVKADGNNATNLSIQFSLVYKQVSRLFQLPPNSYRLSFWVVGKVTHLAKRAPSQSTRAFVGLEGFHIAHNVIALWYDSIDIRYNPLTL